MKRNYAVLFLLLFSASIFGGMSLGKNYDYSMIVGACLGTVFLISAAYMIGKKEQNSQKKH